jgi:hypothetical protein
MSDQGYPELSVREICEAWVNAGMGDECFWEGWPECPTPYNSLTPNMVLDALEIDGKKYELKGV